MNFILKRINKTEGSIRYTIIGRDVSLSYKGVSRAFERELDERFIHSVYKDAEEAEKAKSKVVAFINQEMIFEDEEWIITDRNGREFKTLKSN